MSISESAQIAIPKIKADSLKFWWDDTLDDLKNNSVNSFRLWKSVGKPRNGPIFEEMSRHRLLYRNQIRANKNSSLIQISNDLHDALLKKDTNGFWKCWKNKCCKKSKDPMTVNGLTNNQEIVNEFANHFQNLSKPLQKSKFHDFIDESNYNLNGKLESSNYCIDIETVDRLVKSSKTGKAAGLDGLTAEHLQFAHPICILILCKLFNLMLKFSYVPNAFGIGVLVPISKKINYSSIYNTDYFRGITLSPIISKIFEHCLLQLFGSFLLSDERQFGFKKGKGCRDAIHCLSGIVNFYTSNNTTVNICTVDLSKAFDNLNHSVLFQKLVKRNVPNCFILLLQNWYGKCSCLIKFENCFSKIFPVQQGVRQGGALSPILFALYVDDSLKKFNDSNIGCNLYNVFFCAFMYADDIVLLTASVEHLHKLISLCYEEFISIGLDINVAKCSATRVGPRYKNICDDITINDKVLPWVHEIKYLGLTFSDGLCLKVNVHPNKVAFFRNFIPFMPNLAVLQVLIL